MDAQRDARTDHRAEDGDSALGHLLTEFERRRVVVLGDVMLDRYVLGEVRRISPEAPIPVLRAAARRSVPGGAANVARNVASMGARAVLVGVVGDDAGASELASLLAAHGNIENALVAAANRATTVKTRFMSGPHQLLRLDEEDQEPIGGALESAVLERFEMALAGADAVVISDYAKGVLTDRVLRVAIERARAARVPVIADPKRATFAAYRHATVLTPNHTEAAGATGIHEGDDEAVEASGRLALQQSEADAVVVTRSERGLTLVRRDGPALHVPTRARAVADVSGAGDTFVAAFAIMLAGRATLDDAAVIANIAAGVSVGKPGTATVDHAELVAALHHRELQAAEDKVVDLGLALARVAKWRSQGYRVGFTNGCFDLIHPGHVRLLQAARAACDRLVVGLNSDASVKRLKGPERPVQNEMARATVMASIASADLVVLFEEDTPERLIEAIRPDILFKGADYRIDQVVGGAFVQQHGGRVVLIDLEEGHSTTNTIRRIAAANGVLTA
ncbi:MAG TPA: D-glycero-beta-D-manno-heptose-7-phosphate kinase [Acetobacteraceae bacterium]|jgi:D-beta-D-heptose 7-phosphate kinase/D-beta-D-heptose 1-phosphate adenosyltransferase|nr:D-glycero-beta-D-manno-heptose-7-phosphate kinase [Acetobacteraceae bacterium]